MADTIPQHILDALTDVSMPRAQATRAPNRTLHVAGAEVPVITAEALVLGSGAAGLRAAVELARRGVDVVVATRALYWGTSACSGSDKQTLHTASTGARGDDFLKLADALSAGGAMDRDVAYVEAVGSIDALGGLKLLGLPLPEDRFGAVLRYRTDHDEAGRATSCGPRTSRLMVKVLAEEAARLSIPVVDHTTALKLLTTGEGTQRRVVGLLAAGFDARGPANPFGLRIFLAPSVVLATGGPGELYRDSVYPRHCFGSLGMALEAGIEAVNLTESQFGVGTRRDEFPWNLSGTYMQAMPYIYSVDDAGTERNFLADYYRTTQELASNIFRKGYQWPFHASRMLDFGSSLIDLAIFLETQAGRTVLMDFSRNPLSVPGDAEFSLERLDDDVRAYLGNNEALLASPLKRLVCMNPLSIELYKRYGRDLTRAPLPFAVNNQHMNGGLAVDTWGRTSLAGCYAVGEAAGTHGVTRPGGSALNAGQVFGIRCAKHIAGNRGRAATAPEEVSAQVAEAVATMSADVGNAHGLSIDAVRAEIQARMSDEAGFVCKVEQVAPALAGAQALTTALRQRGLHIATPADAAEAMLWRQTALASEAVLTALADYVAAGGGSRGARVLCAADGDAAPAARTGSLDTFRFRSERTADRAEQILVVRDGATFRTRRRPVRPLPDLSGIYFEKNWPAYLTGSIYRDEER